MADLSRTSRAQLNHGETLQEFSARVLGDASLWSTVASLNNLAAPFVGPVPALRVAVYGDTLLIPSSSPDIEPGATLAEDVMKQDVALHHGQMRAENGDISLVAGRDNLGQALGIRVMTDHGELLFHLEYGCKVASLKGQRADPVNALMAKSYVEKAVASDVRVASIDGSSAVINGDAVNVDVWCQSVTGHPVNTKIST